ncbi:MAG: DUF512 domain-containing protein [Clostridiales bacterium]
MKNKKIIKNVIEDSIANEVGIEKGDEFLKINDNDFIDIFDYKYLIIDTFVLLTIKKANGEIWEIEIEKDEYEDIGIEFCNDLIDGEKFCKNNCIFCFIDQLPKNMRKTLYFKDDDSRLSFLTGNYVTLTNIHDTELKRLVKYKFSPINISVHTTNPKLRVKMLKNPKAENIIESIKYLTENNIKVNCQIVLCKNINDGEEMKKTIEDLASFYDNMQSISIVPVGLTKYRDNLHKLESFDKESSKDVIREVELIQNLFLIEYGSRIVYLADEFYLNARVEFPNYGAYEDFPQIENGVGLYTKFEHDFLEYLDGLEIKKINLCKISLITGKLIYSKLRNLLDKLEKYFIGLKLYLYPIENNFFGKNVTVTGLITGRDIIDQLKDENLDDILLICKSMLKSDEDIFLDDYKLTDIERALNVKILPVDNDAKDLINVIINIVQKY